MARSASRSQTAVLVASSSPHKSPIDCASSDACSSGIATESGALVKSLMCPGETPTPGSTGQTTSGSSALRWICAVSEIQLPASGLDKRLACPVEHGLVFVARPVWLQASIGHQSQVIGDLFIHVSRQGCRVCWLVASMTMDCRQWLEETRCSGRRCTWQRCGRLAQSSDSSMSGKVYIGRQWRTAEGERTKFHVKRVAVATIGPATLTSWSRDRTNGIICRETHSKTLAAVNVSARTYRRHAHSSRLFEDSKVILRSGFLSNSCGIPPFRLCIPLRTAVLLRAAKLVACGDSPQAFERARRTAGQRLRGGRQACHRHRGHSYALVADAVESSTDIFASLYPSGAGCTSRLSRLTSRTRMVTVRPRPWPRRPFR